MQGHRSFLHEVRWLVVTAIFGANAVYGLDPDRTIAQYVHRIVQTEQGSIRAFAQSSDGYLLLGGQGGLARFDGSRFSPISGEWVRSILEDAQGRLWIGTNDAGVLRMDHGISRRFTKADGLPSDSATCLVSDRDGNVWACTPNGLVQFDRDRIHVYQTRHGLPVNRVLSACSAADGTLWLVGDTSLITSWNGSAFRSIALSSVPANTRVRSILCSSDGSLWVGSSDGLIQIKNGHQRLWTTQNGLVDNRVYAVMQSADGTLWIGTREGFSRLHNGHFENFRSKDGLSQSNIYALFEDREGNIWAGTKRGLDQFLDGPAILYTSKDGLPSASTGPVLFDEKKQLWVGTLGGGLGRFDGRGFSVINQRSGLSSNSVYSLSQDGGGDLWASTKNGINRLRNGRVIQTLTTRDGLPSDKVRSLFRDRSGAIWAGTEAGPAILVDRRFVQPPALSRALAIPILAMGEDHSGRFFFGTEHGVFSFATGKVDRIQYHGASILNADTFYTDPDGLVWIGTAGNGLRLFDHGKVSAFFLEDGIYDNVIYGIVGDSQNRLWFTGTKGLDSVNRADLRRFAAGELKKLINIPYTPMDSLYFIEGRSGSQPAIVQTNDGRLVFSANRGLVIFDPNRHRRDSSAPPVAIEQILVNGETSEAKSLEKLPPGEKNLEFRYTGINFTLPARITFRYKLEGYDKDWIDAGTRREAYYTKLPPGKFRFRVTACTAEGVCNEAGSSIDFGLPYRYYQRAWFFPGCAAVVGLASWLLHRLRVLRLRERYSLVLAERSRIARELHDTLIHGLSGLTMQVQALTDRRRFREDQDALEEIIRDAAACMRETRQSVVGLRCAQESGSGLAAAIGTAAEQIAKETNICLKLHLDEDARPLLAEVEHNLLYIAREAVSNSVRHSGAQTIEVVLSWSDRQLRLSVKDDGHGFDRQNGVNQLAGHYGLIGMKERANLIGAEFDLKSWPGRGTSVSISLPAAKVKKPADRVKEATTR